MMCSGAAFAYDEGWSKVREALYVHWLSLGIRPRVIDRLPVRVRVCMLFGVTLGDVGQCIPLKLLEVGRRSFSLRAFTLDRLLFPPNRKIAGQIRCGRVDLRNRGLCELVPDN